MADEINRASPRTQSALLQAMQEYDTSRSPARAMTLPRPFHCASRPRTRSSRKAPIPLPEAQLDRFLMQINVRLSGRSKPSGEMAVGDHRIRRAGRRGPPGNVTAETADGGATSGPYACLSVNRSIDDDPGSGPLRLGRTHSEIELRQASRCLWGPGPRASQALMLAASAHAQFLMDGRLVAVG